MNSKHPGTRLVDLNQSERNRVHQKMPQNASFQCYWAIAFSPLRFFLFNRRVALRMWWVSARHPSVGLPADFRVEGCRLRWHSRQRLRGKHCENRGVATLRTGMWHSCHQVLAQCLLTTHIWYNAVTPANKFRVIASEFQCVSFGLPSPSASLVLSRQSGPGKGLPAITSLGCEGLLCFLAGSIHGSFWSLQSQSFWFFFCHTTPQNLLA